MTRGEECRLAVDWGNSALKAGIFRGRELVDRVVCASGDAEPILALARAHRPLSAMLAEVSGGSTSLLLGLQALGVVVQRLGPGVRLPFHLRYDPPQALGMDRVAALSGAVFEFGPVPLLVVDLGTAITYDAVDARGEYLGGAISPGFGLRLRALHEHTARLPLVDPNFEADLLGRATVPCIQAGVLTGVLGEIERYAHLLRAQHQVETVVLAGGNAENLRGKLFCANFARPNLVLMGLNELMRYNAKD